MHFYLVYSLILLVLEVEALKVAAYLPLKLLLFWNAKLAPFFTQKWLGVGLAESCGSQGGTLDFSPFFIEIVDSWLFSSFIFLGV